jgi:hypothetical protein
MMTSLRTFVVAMFAMFLVFALSLHAQNVNPEDAARILDSASTALVWIVAALAGRSAAGYIAGREKRKVTK